MISKPLFRVGDFVTIRDDIVSDTNVYYSMLQPDARNIFVSGCYTLFGNRYRIQSACGQYNCEGSPLGLTDEMFQEGKRIMQYLHYTDEPANELGVGYLDYELLDTLCGEAGRHMTRAIGASPRHRISHIRRGVIQSAVGVTQST